MKVYLDISPSMLEELCLKYTAVHGEMHSKQIAEMIWVFDDNLVTSSMRVERIRNALNRLQKRGLLTSELVSVERNNTRRYYKRIA